MRVPNGLAFSDFRGYENWQVVSTSRTDDLLKVMVANPAMIDAYRAGIPGNGKTVPDGAMMAKIEWTKKNNAASPYAVAEPEALKSVSLNECRIIDVALGLLALGLLGPSPPRRSCP